MIVDVGLCICIIDFQTVEDAVIYPSDGGAHHRVVFRALVFRPFAGECIVGTVIGSNEEGMRVSLDFFDDVFIPHYLLPHPSEYDARAKLWAWKYEGAEEPGIFNIHEQIRFRVESVAFKTRESVAGGAAPGGGEGGGEGGADHAALTSMPPKPHSAAAAAAETSSSPPRDARGPRRSYGTSASRQSRTPVA